MQQNQQGRRFADVPPQQPVYRFPQNQPAKDWQAQPNIPQSTREEVHLSPREQRRVDRAHRKGHKRRFSLLWNMLAVIGLITVLVQLARYVVIPLLVYLNVLTGGAL